MFYCSDQWIRHDSYGLPRIYMIEYTINPNFIEYDEFYPVPKFNYILNLFFTYPVMLYLISILISMFRFNPFFGLSSEIYSNAFATLFLFYFIIISYRYLSILKSIQIINKKDN